ncbi:MAG: polyphenol oxidase family protein [Spirochaetaceae bacterium]|nr:MAG: polyphenol oxidase family protein [Spirochaetaceae bacterium]
MPEFELALKEEEQSAPIPLGAVDGQTGYPPTISDLKGWISLKRAGDMGDSTARNNPNRVRYLRRLGIRADRHVYSCRQVHSREVVIVGDQNPESVAVMEADGLITSHPEAVLTVTVADCLPIYLVDREHGIFALLHSGWRGTGIVIEALERMRRTYGSQPSRIAASIGPGIGACCYRVEEDRYLEFRRRFGERSVRRKNGLFYLDLPAANIESLRSWGVKDISVCSDCSACTHQLASFRREGPGFSHMLACVGVMGND